MTALKIKLDIYGPMVFDNSQDQIIFDIPTRYSKVGVKISGGADSALVTYMLARYVSEIRTDIKIIPISLNAKGKHYQQLFASKVLNKISELTGVVFGKHYYTTIDASTSEAYVNGQEKFVDSLYSQRIMHCHLAGITANPDIKEAPHLFGPNKGLPSDDRTKLPQKRQQLERTCWRPLINIDKKGVAELYNKLGIIDTIFPLTRSCEAITEDFSKHCGKCWFCEERLWGFGRLE